MPARQHPAGGQVVEGDVDEMVAADRHARVRHDVADRREPGPVGQLHVQQRLGGGEGPLRPAVVGGQVLQLRDQVLVAVGDRRPGRGQGSVAQPQDGALCADDVDVFDIAAIQQGLQPAQTPDEVLHLLRDQDFVVAAQRRVAAVEAAAGFEAELVFDPAAHQLPLVGQLEPVAVGMAAQLLDHQRPDVFGQRPIGGRGRHDATAPGEPSNSAADHSVADHVSAAAHLSGGANASATCRAARCRGLRDKPAAGGRPVAPHGGRAGIVGQLADQRRLTAGGDLRGRVGLSGRDDQQGGAGAERPGPQQVEQASRGADRGQGRAGHHQDPVTRTRAGRGCRAAVQVAAQIAQHIDGLEAGQTTPERRPRHRGGLGGAAQPRQRQRGVLARPDHQAAQRDIEGFGAAARHQLQQMTPRRPGAAAQTGGEVTTGRVGVHHDRGPRPCRGDRQRCWW